MAQVPNAAGDTGNFPGSPMMLVAVPMNSLGLNVSTPGKANNGPSSLDISGCRDSPAGKMPKAADYTPLRKPNINNFDTA